MSLLSLKLNDVDTSYPLLTNGDHIVAIDSATLEPSKKDDRLLNLKVVYKTVNDSQDQNGHSLGAGYKLTTYYPIPSEYRDEDKNANMLKNITLLALAVCGLENNEAGKSQLPEFDESFIANMAGKQVLAKVKTSKPAEDDQYGPKSEIASVRALLG
jgi:hypothetical protein